MNATVNEWVANADGDFRTAERELHPAGTPNFDAVCFHAERCVGKVMKALLIHLNVIPPRTHDLVALDCSLTPVCRTWSWRAKEPRLLSAAAVDVRYPGDSADMEEASEAFDICSRMRTKLLSLLGVSP
jgi:HEPN domain-containing protein